MKKIGMFLLAACIITGISINMGDEIYAAEDMQQTGSTVTRYDMDSGTWNGTNLILSNGEAATDGLFCDGTYTYYLQTDGTAMKNRVSYHPDGEHIIYFDENGHEVFNEFKFCQDLKYTAYFDVYGYMYKNQTTYDENGKLYYLDNAGRMKQGEWFQFDETYDYGYAYADGSLKTDGFSYDPWSRVVFFQMNGKIARGLVTDGKYTYNMSVLDGHLVGQWLN